MRIILLLLYFLLLLLGINHHEMWRDELEAWLISANSSSIPELLHRVKYECHPPLLYLCLFVLGKFSRNPIIMQYFNLTIACIAICVFLKYSPFNKFQKILFCFSYFPLYEYGVISRSYSLVLFFLFTSCVLFGKEVKNYFLISLMLLFLASTHVYGLFIAVGFEIAVLLDYFIYRKDIMSSKLRELIFSFLIFSSGIILLLVQLSLPEDCYYRIGLFTKFSIYQLLITLGIIWRAYFAMPAFTYNFCDSNILNTFGDLKTQVVLSALFGFLILILLVFLFRKKPVPLVFFTAGTFCILLFTYFRFYGSLRQHGFLYLLFVASLWISAFYKENYSFGKIKNILLTITLCFHLIYGAYAYAMDLIYPFSESKETADYIKEHNLSDLPIVASIDSRVSPITAFLNKEVYYPSSNRYGTFVIWDKNVNNKVTPFVLFNSALKILEEHQQGVLLVLSDELITLENGQSVPLNDFYIKPGIKLSKIAGFSKSIRGDENYYIYKVSKES